MPAVMYPAQGDMLCEQLELRRIITQQYFVIIQRKKVKKVLDRVFASKVRSARAIKVTEHSIFN